MNNGQFEGILNTPDVQAAFGLIEDELPICDKDGFGGEGAIVDSPLQKCVRCGRGKTMGNMKHTRLYGYICVCGSDKWQAEIPPRPRTHYEWCWRNHFECAVNKAIELEAQTGLLKTEIAQLKAERDAASHRASELLNQLTETMCERDAARRELENANAVGQQWYEDICEIRSALAQAGFPLLDSENIAEEGIAKLAAERGAYNAALEQAAQVAEQYNDNDELGVITTLIARDIRVRQHGQ